MYSHFAMSSTLRGVVRFEELEHSQSTGPICSDTESSVPVKSSSSSTAWWNMLSLRIELALGPKSGMFWVVRGQWGGC